MAVAEFYGKLMDDGNYQLTIVESGVWHTYQLTHSSVTLSTEYANGVYPATTLDLTVQGALADHVAHVASVQGDRDTVDRQSA